MLVNVEVWSAHSLTKVDVWKVCEQFLLHFNQSIDRTRSNVFPSIINASSHELTVKSHVILCKSIAN